MRPTPPDDNREFCQSVSTPEGEVDIWHIPTPDDTDHDLVCLYDHREIDLTTPPFDCDYVTATFEWPVDSDILRVSTVFLNHKGGGGTRWDHDYQLPTTVEQALKAEFGVSRIYLDSNGSARRHFREVMAQLRHQDDVVFTRHGVFCE